MRLGAAACAAPAGAALALTFSRGAIVAAAVGLVALVALAPTRRQLRAVLVVAASAAVAASWPPRCPRCGRWRARGRPRARSCWSGSSLLGAAAALAVRRGPGRTAPCAAFAPRSPWRAVIVALGARGRCRGAGDRHAARRAPPSRGSGRRDSNRYAYWRVALDGFAGAPLQGHGAGSFGVLWLRDRTVPEVVRDAHSIWLETAAELGLVGLALLAALFGGIVLAARRAPRRRASPGRRPRWSCGRCTARWTGTGSCPAVRR